MLLLSLVIACDTEKIPEEIPETSAVTWHQGIDKLVSENCQRCHSSAQSLTFPLEDYELVKAMAPLMLDKVQGSDTPPFFMPPFNAVEGDECRPPASWKHNPRLEAEEIQLLSDWIAADYPLGDEESAYAIEATADLSLSGADVQTLMSAGAAIAAGETEDQYRCFPLDPQLSETKWITGLEVLPGNADLVHHVVIFSDPDGASEAQVDEAGGYDCYGSANVPNSGVLFAWAPGGEPMRMPDESGFAMSPGEKLVAQVHYHPVYDSAEEMSDQTGLKIQWRDTAPDKTVLYEVLGGVFENNVNSPQWDDPPFEIPAGASNHSEVWREPMTQIPSGADIRIFGLFPHMHMLGRDIRISLAHEDGSETCLAHIPNYDFEWQLTYMYDAPIAELPSIQPSDTLVISCTYDNSDTNPFFQEYLATAGITAPVDVGVGENTLDEMCTGIIGVVY